MSHTETPLSKDQQAEPTSSDVYGSTVTPSVNVGDGTKPPRRWPMWRIILCLFVAVSLGTWEYTGGNLISFARPDCASDTTIQTLTSIAKENPQNPLFRQARMEFIFSSPTFHGGSASSITNERIERISAQVDGKYMDCLRQHDNFLCNGLRDAVSVDQIEHSSYKDYRTGGQRAFSQQDLQYFQANFLAINIELAKLRSQVKAQQEKENGDEAASNAELERSANYSVDTIRMLRREPTSGSLTCRATLRLKTLKNRYAGDVEYTVEKTSDNELYVTVQRFL